MDQQERTIIVDESGRQQSMCDPHPPLHHVDYTSQNGPCLSYIWHHDSDLGFLYSGAQTGCDSNIYCIPSQATRVLKINTITHELQSIGPTLNGTYKWAKGVTTGDVIYGLPCHADTVLRIHVPTGDISTITIPYDESYPGKQASVQRRMTWKYQCGALSPMDGCIYAIPQSAAHVLKINPITDTCEFLVHGSTPGAEPGRSKRSKWNDCVLGVDGALYGIPNNHTSVLRIDPSSADIVTLHGCFSGTNKWDGGVASSDGTIVCVPANSDTVLCIVPGKRPELYEIENNDVIQTGRHRSDNKCKYSGATMGQDGTVYCFPNGAEYVLQIDTTTKNVQQVGPNMVDANMECVVHNKWKNGQCCGDNRVYAIPHSSESVLQMDTGTHATPKVTTWPLPSACKGVAKWEGATVTSSGVMYGIPSNHKAILRISSVSLPVPQHNEPRTKVILDKKTENDGEAKSLLYNTGIPTLRSSAHRVKYTTEPEVNKPKDQFSKSTSMAWLPKAIRNEDVLDYDVEEYDFSTAIATILSQCDETVVGAFPPSTPRSLVHFCLPPQSLNRGDYGGQCETAQRYLSAQLYSNDAFLQLFDRFVAEVVVPHFKRRLAQAAVVQDGDEGILTFFCQRPPTLRLQPGPARAYVNTHHDAKYGHQNGELNFWLPLTDRNLTRVDLHVESSHMKGDFHPMVANPGQVVSFHGTSCRHYVNANVTPWTRVSLDFRIGVEGFFDPQWVMPGTTCDHDRKVVQL